MQEREQSAAAASRSVPKAARIDLAEFSEALSTGVLRAIEARRLAPDFDRPDQFDWRPWIWAGWIIGTGGPFDPSGPGGPFGGGGPGGPGQ